jgi:hypothetical protein
MSAAAHVDHHIIDHCCRWSRTGCDGVCLDRFDEAYQTVPTTPSGINVAAAIGLGACILSLRQLNQCQARRRLALAAPATTPNPHSAQHRRVRLSRGFLHWRLPYAGPRVRGPVCAGRRPEPFTRARKEGAHRWRQQLLRKRTILVRCPEPVFPNDARAVTTRHESALALTPNCSSPERCRSTLRSRNEFIFHATTVKRRACVAESAA